MDWSFLRLLRKNIICVLQNITVAILLQMTEQVGEHMFICWCNAYSICFVCVYFSVPAVAFVAFDLSLQQGNVIKEKSCADGGSCCADGGSCCKRCEDECSRCRCGERCGERCEKTRRFFLSSWQTLYAALCWVVILLIDGKYVACLLYSKCNSDTRAVDTMDLEMEHGMVVSQVCGCLLAAVFAAGYFLSLCWRRSCRSLADWHEETYTPQLEEDRAADCCCREAKLRREAKSYLEAASGGDLLRLELEENPSEPAPEHGARGAANQKRDKLHAENIAKIINEELDFPFENEYALRFPEG